MQRLNPSTVRPGPDEILELVDVYGVKAGEAYRGFQHFDGVQDICILIRTGGKTETHFEFSADSLMGNIMGGLRDLIMSDHAWSFSGDEGNVAMTSYGEQGTPNGSLLFFINDVDEDPAGVRYVMKYVYDPSRRRRVLKQVPVAPGYWLKPYTDYYLTYRRLELPEGEMAMLTLHHVATDDPEHGGEVVIESPDPGVPDVTIDGTVRMFSPFTGRPGVFIEEA